LTEAAVSNLGNPQSPFGNLCYTIVFSVDPRNYKRLNVNIYFLQRRLERCFSTTSRSNS